jgi:3-keto-disaccharide hydrolase
MIRHVLTIAALIGFTFAPAAFAADAVSPFDGKSTAGWKVKGDEKRNKWKVGVAALDEKAPNKIALKDGSGELVNAEAGGIDIYTEQKFGDCTIEVEVMVPKGSNSGIYVMGEYEVQVFDSFGKEKLGQGDMGAIYSAAAPKLNASKKPGEWQKFVIDFQAPKFEGDKKLAKAKFLKVTLNDQVIHENVEVEKSTGGALTGKEAATGPLMFQGDHGPVAYRSIKITPKK